MDEQMPDDRRESSGPWSRAAGVVAVIFVLLLLAVIAASAAVIAKEERDATREQRAQTAIAREAECWAKVTGYRHVGERTTNAGRCEHLCLPHDGLREEVPDGLSARVVKPASPRDRSLASSAPKLPGSHRQGRTFDYSIRGSGTARTT